MKPLLFVVFFLSFQSLVGQSPTVRSFPTHLVDSAVAKPIVYCNILFEFQSKKGCKAVINPNTGKTIICDAPEDYFFEEDSLLVQHTAAKTKVFDKNLTLIHEMDGHFRPFGLYWINLDASGLYSGKGEKMEQKQLTKTSGSCFLNAWLEINSKISLSEKMMCFEQYAFFILNT